MRHPRLLVVTGLALALAVSAAPKADQRSAGQPVAGPTISQFLGAASPIELVSAKRADRIAWIAYDQGRRNVYTAAAPALTPVRLTTYLKDDGVDLTGLRISADGSTVVFVRGSAANRDGWNANPSGDPNTAPRCGARTRAGLPCRAPAVRGKTRCRLHGDLSTGPGATRAASVADAPAGSRATIHRKPATAARLEVLRAPRPAFDPAAVRRTVRGYLDDWQGLLRGHVRQAQQVLRRFIVGRLTPNRRGYYTFEGRGTVRPLLAGVVRNLASLPPASWNQIAGWLKQIDGLRQLA